MSGDRVSFSAVKIFILKFFLLSRIITHFSLLRLLDNVTLSFKSKNMLKMKGCYQLR